MFIEESKKFEKNEKKRKKQKQKQNQNKLKNNIKSTEMMIQELICFYINIYVIYLCFVSLLDKIQYANVNTSL